MRSGDAADCDDSDAAVHPTAIDDCEDGLDNDCDGATDCDDDECASEPVCLISWSDDFEDGSWSDTWTTDSTYHSQALDGTTSAGGSTSFTQIASSGGHYHGVHAEVPAHQYDSASFWVRTSSCPSSGADGYVVIGDDNTPSNNGIVFFYILNGSLSFYDSGTHELEPCVANQWFEVELFFDWAATTYDVWIDGSYRDTINFRTSSTTEITRIYLYNFSAGYQAWWDEIELY